MKRRGFSAVLWDFGGVLTTSPFDAFAAYELANGLPAGAIRQLNANNPDSNAWAGFERGHIGADEFADRFEEEAAAAGLALDARELIGTLRGDLRPEMVEALRRCREKFKTGLLTNNFIPAAPAEPSPEESDSLYASVLSYFDVVLESSITGMRKPEPAFYLLACELLEIDPSEAVFLDDLGVNLKPARALGMHTIKVEDPAQALKELEAAVGIPLG